MKMMFATDFRAAMQPVCTIASPYDDRRGEIHSIWQADRASFRMSSNSLTEEHGA